MIKALLDAIYKKFTDGEAEAGETALYDYLSGGLYFQQAPQKASSPYGVYFVVGDDRDEAMGGRTDCIHNVEIQFNIFDETDDGGAALMTISDSIDKLYAWQTMTITGYSWIATVPQLSNEINYVDGAWQLSNTYNIMLSN